MEIIERPMGSTSYKVDIIAHLIKNVNELNNIMSLNIGKNIFIIRHLIEPGTFQPQVLIGISNQSEIERTKLLIAFECEFYVIPVVYQQNEDSKYTIKNNIIVEKTSGTSESEVQSN